jgi:hypothetical protein
MRSSSTASWVRMQPTSTKHDRIKGSDSRFPSRKLVHGGGNNPPVYAVYAVKAFP